MQGISDATSCSTCLVTIAFWRDVVAGEWQLREGVDPQAVWRTEAVDVERALAVVRGEAFTAEVEATGSVWITLGRIAAFSPIDVQAHACRIQARALSRSCAARIERRQWLMGAAKVAATEPESRRRCGRTMDVIKKVLDRELAAAVVEQRYDLLHGDPWPTGVLRALDGVAEADGRRMLATFGGRVPSASRLRALTKRAMP